MSQLQTEFLNSLGFQADPFQLDALQSLEKGRGVLVTSPTGSGKTTVAEAAAFYARSNGRKTFYTTPIKALSNQKYDDFRRTYGDDSVGLLTGDNSINGDASIVVMTTEVLRNMIYTDISVLDEVEFVILDEVHYLQDRFRGPVWEEIIIHAPSHVKLVCLSATVSNADQLATWLMERRGNIDLVKSETRPVPLENLYAMADRSRDSETRLWPLFSGNKKTPNSSLQRMLGADRGRRARFVTPRRLELVGELAEARMLPALFFVFSRAGCDGAARELISAGVRLTKEGDVPVIREIVEAGTSHLADEDLTALDYSSWLAGLEMGIAVHHAGMVPAFKEVVEELFRAGLVKVVFATETLALGINMPARTVVLDSLTKFDGETHSMMTPGDYTQLTGRAGRRGIDDIGYGVVLHSRFVRFQQVIEVAASGSHPLRSSFRPNYNMAVNLVANYQRGQVEELLAASFAQFLREETGSESSRRLEALEVSLRKDLADAECDRGSIREYATLVESGPQLGVETVLQPGDVVAIPRGRTEGRYLIIRRLPGSKTSPRFLAIGTSGRTVQLGRKDLVANSQRIGEIRIEHESLKDRRFRETVRKKLRGMEARQGDPAKGSDHPVKSCPDAAKHLHAFRRAIRTERRVEQMRNHLRTTGHGLVEEFDGILTLLEDWGYLDKWSLTSRGRRLRFVYNESDLLLCEALENGLFWGLDASETAAFASVFVYESRSEEPSLIRFPTERLEERWKKLQRLEEKLSKEERFRRLSVSSRIDPGFVTLSYLWTKGTELRDLPSQQAAPGDFVRVSRQLVDLLRQLREAAPEESDVISLALRSLDRGVVAATGAG